MKDELLQQLKMYEGKWVALLGTEDDMTVVAAGEDAAEAIERAVKKGYTETTLLKILPSDVAYVPMA
jgi:uncharacterized protein DUF5678